MKLSTNTIIKFLKSILLAIFDRCPNCGGHIIDHHYPPDVSNLYRPYTQRSLVTTKCTDCKYNINRYIYK